MTVEVNFPKQEDMLINGKELLERLKGIIQENEMNGSYGWFVGCYVKNAIESMQKEEYEKLCKHKE